MNTPNYRENDGIWEIIQNEVGGTPRNIKKIPDLWKILLDL